jgi:hypothetical protein
MYEHVDATLTIVSCDFPRCDNKSEAFFAPHGFTMARTTESVEECRPVYVGPGAPTNPEKGDTQGWWNLCPEHYEYRPQIELIKKMLDERDV